MNASRAVAVTLLLALSASGQTLAFRNDSAAAVVVQTATVLRGRLKSDRPTVLKPGTTSSSVPLDGEKMITVYDARSNRILFQGMQHESSRPLRFSIQPDGRTPGKMKLVPSP